MTLLAQAELEAPLCPWCGEEERLEVFEVWPEERAAMFETCCEGSYEEALETMRDWAPRDWARFFRESAGLEVRQVVTDAASGQWTLDWGLELEALEPGDLGDAKAWVDRHHRHNVAPLGWRWGHAVRNGPDRVGVAIVGSPVARRLAELGSLVEVTRLCIDPTLEPGLVWNACSMLYAAAAREAKARGFDAVVTYTLEEEAGTTLRAAGFVPVHRTKAESWHRAGRPRQDKAPTSRKIRWERGVSKAGKARVAQLAQEFAQAEARRAARRSTTPAQELAA